jgi:hypothetical protein
VIHTRVWVASPASQTPTVVVSVICSSRFIHPQLLCDSPLHTLHPPPAIMMLGRQPPQLHQHSARVAARRGVVPHHLTSVAHAQRVWCRARCRVALVRASGKEVRDDQGDLGPCTSHATSPTQLRTAAAHTQTTGVRRIA